MRCRRCVRCLRLHQLCYARLPRPTRRHALSQELLRGYEISGSINDASYSATASKQYSLLLFVRMTKPDTSSMPSQATSFLLSLLSPSITVLFADIKAQGACMACPNHRCYAIVQLRQSQCLPSFPLHPVSPSSLLCFHTPFSK